MTYESRREIVEYAGLVHIQPYGLEMTVTFMR